MPAQLTAIVLIENTATDGLLSEHDLSVHLDYHKPNGRELRLLLDFGHKDPMPRGRRRWHLTCHGDGGGGISHGHITASMAGVAGMNNLLTTLFIVSRFEI